MTKIIAIDNDIINDPPSFEVTWDMGRRCNFDCTYCPDHRHNNTSPHASLETLIKTSKFVFDYKKLMQEQMTFNRIWRIGFTGGEPTNNPNFLNMCEYIQEQNDPDIKVDVTSNGTFNEKYCNKLINTVDSATISYHCEEKQKVKDRVVERIYQLKDYNFKYKVNLMIHANPIYFKECMQLVERFTKDNIRFVPRIIGEHYDNDRYSHRYTSEQHKFFRDFWANKNKKINDNKPDESKDAEYEYKDDKEKVKQQKEETKSSTRKDLGRPCCGQRVFHTLDENEYKNNNKQLDTNKWKKSVFACATEYKEWSCMINWNWLHIEQEYDRILHHQTCRANFGGKRGEIGTITNCDKIIEQLEKQFATGTMPVITCPNKVCGCGLCVPKSQHNDITEAMFSKAIKNLKPIIGAELNG